MIEYTVHFQKGYRIGARSLRLIQVNAPTAALAMLYANRQFVDRKGYRVIRVDHFEDMRLVIDWEA